MSGANPYFMTNPEWYQYVEDGELKYGSNYVLTDAGKAIKEVVESYNEFLQDDAMSCEEEGEEEQAKKLFGLKD